jgi:hypothetical protein
MTNVRGNLPIFGEYDRNERDTALRSPAVVVVAVKNEGIICGSGGTEDYNRPNTPYNW